MKNILHYILLLSCMTSFGQKEVNINLDWKETPLMLSDNINVNIPHFQSEYFHYDGSKNIILFTYSYLNSSENDFVISNITYENITKEQLGRLDSEKLPKEIRKEVSVSRGRQDSFLTIEFEPIIKEGNSFKKVKSFTLTPSQTYSTYSALDINDVPTLTNSVLSTGEWYKFYVETSGIYKLSRSFIQSLGMNLNNVNPQKIKIYGNGGRMIPLRNNVTYPFDLEENAIQVIGEQDGKFDSQDYILFYAEGVDTYNQESDTHLNLYSNRSYYYITSSGINDGKRISTMSEPAGSSTLSVSEFDDYQFYERDLNNFARMDRKWFGETFNIQNEQTFKFTFPNLVTSVPIKFKGNTALNSHHLPATFTFSANGNTIGTIAFAPGTSNADYSGRERALTTTFNASSENVDITVAYNNNGVPTVTGYLDYIAITARRQLRGTGKQFSFFYDEAQNNIGIIEYQINSANTIKEVWDVTDIFNTTKKENSGNTTFSFKANMGEKRKYIALEPNDYYTPLRETQNMQVTNQNLKGDVFKNNNGAFTDVDYIIVTPAFLNAQAEKLANFHRNNSGLVVKVVNLENIYQEFSSGKQDIGAIRNFIRYVYHNASQPDKRIKYLNLFGDASYDFKNRIQGNTNIVPIFQPYTGDGRFYTGDKCSDDYFVMMDNNEGSLANTDRPDIAVGRMLVSTVTQAEQMVQKVVDYYDQQSYGRWRNSITLISDDVDESSDRNMQSQMDQLAKDIEQNRPFFNISKIYTDAYVQETASGGARYPQARTDIVNAFESGSLIFNYLGHGGEEGLAHERIFEKSDGQNLGNRFKYPLFITVTCSFTKFDNPLRPTAGEYVYWNPTGGAVAMITTTRVIGIGTAENFNLRLGEVLFSYGNYADQPYPTIGEALRLAKNYHGGMNATRMVACVGDPALQLAIPQPNIVLTHINDTPLNNYNGSLEALSYVKMKGEVTNESGNLLSNYTGELAIQIFDKKISRSTLGNDGYIEGGQLLTMDFDILGETIFRGNVTVVGGIFEFDFVVPKDIRIPIDYGKVSFYSKRLNPLEDKAGYSKDIRIGGINENAPVDNIPPTVKLYMNDTNFISGGITNHSPIFLAYLEDENGMNTAGGIGHDMIAILDGDETNPYILNDYYQTELDDYTKGKVSYPFRNLAPGLHTITFKAWDVYNNMVAAEIQFIVVGDDKIQLENVLNYPNPFVSYTEFWFSHNRPFEPLDVQVQVLTITGKVVWTKNQTIITEGFLSRDITWDGKDDFGDKIGKGVYVYKLTVKSTLTGKKAEKYEKLVIL